MQDPAQNSKARAQRIDRQYFRSRIAMSRWRSLLVLIAAVVGLGWLVWRATAHDQSVFSSGPVNPRHASFEKECASCHVGASTGASVTDQACLTCHDGPMHNKQQISAPACVACHVEHRGAPQLLGEGDRACTECHGSLKTKNGRATVAKNIESFTSGHPEFIPLRAGQKDPGTLKFNHRVHFKKDLKGPSGNVQLECGDCHRVTGIDQPWPYGRKGPAAVEPAMPAEKRGRTRLAARAYMQPVTYYADCSSCHPLQFDKRIAEPAPHQKAEAVVEFMRQRFTAWIAQHPEELRKSADPPRIVRDVSRPAAPSAQEWIGQRMDEAERLLWTKTCVECHSLKGVAVVNNRGAQDAAPQQQAPIAAPQVRESNLTLRWLQHGSFDHGAHTMLDCEGCHRNATKSEKTSDVLLPGIKTCQTCHNQSDSRTSAGSSCFECHQYHDWTKEKPRHGKLRLPNT